MSETLHIYRGVNVPIELEQVPGFNPLLVGEPYFTSTQPVLPESSTHFDVHLSRRDASITSALQWTSYTVQNKRIHRPIYDAYYRSYAIYTKLDEELGTELKERGIVIPYGGRGIDNSPSEHWWMRQGPSGNYFLPNELRLNQAELSEEDIVLLMRCTQVYSTDAFDIVNTGGINGSRHFRLVEEIVLDKPTTRKAFIETMLQTINVEALANQIQRPIL